MIDRKSALNPQSSSRTEPLRFRLLGGFEILQSGVPLPRTRTRTEQWLLGWLLLRSHQQVERSLLAGTFWPESGETQALGNLRRSLNNLRQVLGEESYRIHSPTRSTLTFDLSNASCDLFEFDAAVARGDSTSLERAVALYQGLLLPGCDADWIQPEREARESAYGFALERLAREAMQEGKSAEAVRLLRRLLHRDPYQEAAVCTLMEALAACGDRAGLQLAYRQFRLLLHDELKAEPTPQTRALYEQLRQEASGGKGTMRGDVAAAPPVSADAPKVRLHAPLPVSEMIGREKELAEIASLLSTARLVTLAGTGGIGKTRLSLAIAAHLSQDFADGIWFIDLASVYDPTLVLQTVATALQVREEPEKSLQETLADHLQAKRLLLVMDNCEHLLDACAQIAISLLQRCPSLRILATSRQPLGVTGEHVVRLPSLFVPDVEVLAASAMSGTALMDYPATRLFLERALEASSSFTLTARNAPAIVRICERLDGIPLAIELAAVRVRVLTAEQIAERLDDAFHLLTGGDRTVLPRHQTLQALLDWSYRLLTEPEKRLLSRLSVFAGGWTLEAAEAICSDAADVLDGLTSLIDKSLVGTTESAEGSLRYRLLETVRQYARERLEESVESPEIRARHREWFARFIEQANPRLSGAEATLWLSRVEAERDNLRAARAGGDDRIAFRIAASMWWFWYVKCYWTEGREQLVGLLEAENTGVGNTKERATALRGAGVLARSQGDYGAARRLFEQALEIFREIGSRPDIAHLLNSLGNLLYTMGEYAEARAIYTESLEIFRERDEQLHIANALGNLGVVTMDMGDYPAASKLCMESLALCRALGDRRNLASALNSLGRVTALMGDHGLAHAYFTESLQIGREIQDLRFQSFALSNMGVLAKDQGDLRAARDLCVESLAILQKIGDKKGQAEVLKDLGDIAADQADFTTARPLYLQSLELFQEIKSRQGAALTLNRIAALCMAEGHAETAVRLWGASRALYEALLSPATPYRDRPQDREIAAARNVLDEAAFDRAWAEGNALSLEAAILLARLRHG